MGHTPREDLGRNLADSVRKLSRNSYAAQSETMPDHEYVVQLGKAGWWCECPFHTEKKVVCKHIYAVFTFRKPEPRFVRYVPDIQCPKCRNTHTISKGRRRRYCKTCNVYYTPGVKSHFGIDAIAEGIHAVYAGGSLRKTECMLSQRGIDVSYRNILHWLFKYGPMVDEYTKTLRPRVGDHWRIDEVYMNVAGVKMYAFYMLDTETRYVLDSIVSENKGTDDVRPLFRYCIDITGKKPYLLSSDSAWNFGLAWNDVYRQKNPHDA